MVKGIRRVRKLARCIRMPTITLYAAKKAHAR